MGIHFRNKKKRPAISLLAAISVRGGPLLLMAAKGGGDCNKIYLKASLIRPRQPLKYLVLRLVDASSKVMVAWDGRLLVSGCAAARGRIRVQPAYWCLGSILHAHRVRGSVLEGLITYRKFVSE